MNKSTLYILVTNSTILEGSTLNLAQNTRLLEDGISSEGKTIVEQLRNIDLFKAYQMALKDAEGHRVSKRKDAEKFFIAKFTKCYNLREVIFYDNIFNCACGVDFGIFYLRQYR